MELSVIDNLDDVQVKKLHLLYQKEWFTKGRTLEDVRIMLDNTNFVYGLP